MVCCRKSTRSDAWNHFEKSTAEILLVFLSVFFYFWQFVLFKRTWEVSYIFCRTKFIDNLTRGGKWDRGFLFMNCFKAVTCFNRGLNNFTCFSVVILKTRLLVSPRKIQSWRHQRLCDFKLFDSPRGLRLINVEIKWAMETLKFLKKFLSMNDKKNVH